MKNWRTIAAVLSISSLAGVALWLNHRLGRLRADNTVLRERAWMVQAWQNEHELLEKQLRENHGLSPAEQEELMKLRAQVGTMPRIKRQNELIQMELDRAKKTAAKEPGANDAIDQMWYDNNFGPGSDARAKSQHAMRWGWAVLDYAKQHGGEFPVTLQEAAPFLNSYRYNDKPLTDDEKAQTIATADQFELLYHGNKSAMTNPLPEAAIMLRQQQPFQTPNGKWARYYVTGNGGGGYQFSTDGDFEKYESIRRNR